MDVPVAAPTVLAIPELARMILGHVTDVSSVRLVNNLWASIGFELQWRAPRPTKFMRIPQRSRQACADKIRELDFLRQGFTRTEIHGICGQLSWPNLVYLRLFEAGQHKPYDSAYFQANLRKIDLVGFLSNELMDLVINNCPRLEELSCTALPDNLQRMAVGLKNLPKLKAFGLRRASLPIDQALFARIVSGDQLETLHAGNYLEQSHIAREIQVNSLAFTSLTSLTAGLTTSSLICLAPQLVVIRALYLELTDDDEDVLPAVSKLTTLVNLQLHGRPRGLKFSVASFHALTSLNRLEHLDYSTDQKVPVGCESLDDDAVSEVASFMPCLKNLALSIPNECTYELLIKLARTNRHLEKFVLAVSSDFFLGAGGIDGDDASFPELNTMVLHTRKRFGSMPDNLSLLKWHRRPLSARRVVCDDREPWRATAESVIKVMLGIAPNLGHLFNQATRKRLW